MILEIQKLVWTDVECVYARYTLRFIVVKAWEQFVCTLMRVANGLMENVST